MRKFLVLLAVVCLIVGMSGIADASGELFLSKVIEDDSGYSLSGKYDFEKFYLKADVGFNGDFDKILYKDYTIGADYDVTPLATLVGSYELKESANRKYEIKTVALDTKITGALTTRVQYKQTDSDGEVTIGIGLKF